MRKIAGSLLVGLFAIQPASSSLGAYHRYSVWHYPWPQSCLPDRPKTDQAKLEVLPPARPLDEQVLPLLTDIEWGSLATEEQRARLLLRILLDAKQRLNQ